MRHAIWMLATLSFSMSTVHATVQRQPEAEAVLARYVNNAVSDARIADPFRPAHLVTMCTSVTLEERLEPSGAVGPIVLCEMPDSKERWAFNATTGLVDRLEVTSRSGRTTMISYEDFRPSRMISDPSSGSRSGRRDRSRVR